MINKTLLKQIAIEGTPKEKKVARSILRHDMKKQKLYKLPKYVKQFSYSGGVDDRPFRDFRTPEERLGHLRATFLEKYWVHILGAGIVLYFIGQILVKIYG